jgi:hypothetical protein
MCVQKLVVCVCVCVCVCYIWCCFQRAHRNKTTWGVWVICGCVTCRYNVEYARHDLRSKFVSSPAQQCSVVSLWLRFVARNTSATAWLWSHAVNLDRLDGRIVEGPSEETSGWIGINVTDNAHLLVSRRPVYSLLTRSTHRFIWKSN